MRFSFFALLSGLAALAVVNALPAENLEHGISPDVPCNKAKICRNGKVVHCRPCEPEDE
ncbi:hypothetical protein OG21DRAFT_1507666 [Imleria badia]|nr:hypothetical protein OG21DRAFT_1507666 [Imleria badia]